MFRREHSRDPLPERLVGLWRAEGSDDQFTFFADGSAVFQTRSGDGGTAEILLTWRVEGDEIVTDQPSAPAEERTKFVLRDPELLLEFEGETTCWVRGDYA